MISQPELKKVAVVDCRGTLGWRLARDLRHLASVAVLRHTSI
jgi:hypothetical protein